jgi:hypothetical protein
MLAGHSERFAAPRAETAIDGGGLGLFRVDDLGQRRRRQPGGKYVYRNENQRSCKLRWTSRQEGQLGR